MKKLIAFLTVPLMLLFAGVFLVACNNNGGGGDGGDGDGIVQTKIAAPTGLSVASNLELSWTGVTGANYYNIRINSGTPFSVAPFPTTFSLKTRLTQRITYTIEVQTVATGNDLNSDWAQTQYSVLSTKLAVPENVCIENMTRYVGGLVEWDQVVNITQYEIQVGQSIAGVFSNVTTHTSDSYTEYYVRNDWGTIIGTKKVYEFPLTGLVSNGDAFAVRVKALGDGDEYVDSDYSQLVESVKLSAPDPYYVEDTTTVFWDPIPGATGYRVGFEYVNAEGGGTTWGSSYTNATANTVDFATLMPGGMNLILSGITNYTIRIAAFGNGYNFTSSDWSQDFQFSTGISGLRFAIVPSYMGGTGNEYYLDQYLHKFHNGSKPTSVVVPAYFFGKPVIGIGGGLFSTTWTPFGCPEITSITLPDTIRFIGSDALTGLMNVADIQIPDSVTSIGSHDFYYQPKFYVDAPYNSIVYLGKWAIGIKGTVSGAVTLRSDTVGLADWLFYYNSGAITSINLQNVKYIGRYALSGSCLGITSLHIPANTITIGDIVVGYLGSGVPSTFSGYVNLASITVDSGNQFFKSDGNCLISKEDNVLLLGCMNSVIPNYITRIADRAFYGCTGLAGKTLIIPDSVTHIGNHAFRGCGDFNRIVIGSGVTDIGIYAFNDSFNWIDGTQAIFYKGDLTAWNAITKGGTIGWGATNGTQFYNANYRYYYSETPVLDGKHWYFVGNVPTIWA